MSIKVTVPNNSSDSLIFGSANTTNASQVTGIDSGSSNGQLAFYTTASGVSTERMRIDSSGNVGVGVTPSAWGSNTKAFQFTKGASTGSVASVLTSDEIFLLRNAYYDNTNWRYVASSSNATLYQQSSAGAHIWQTAASGTAGNAITFTQAMTLDSSGNLLVGYTSGGQSSFSGLVKANGYNIKAGAGAALGGNVFNINWTGSPQLWIDVTNIGTIAFTSDYRIKRNIETQTAPALERLMALRPVTYQMADYGTLFKASDDIKEGFIAHEVQEVIPSGAEGVKDDDNQIQSLRVDAILAVAVKAIQELKAELDTVKTELATLKGQA